MKSPITPLLLQLQAFQRLAQQGRLATMPGEQLLLLLKRAEGQLKRLARLVDNLLDVSRISAGRLSLHLETLDLSAIVCEIAEELRAASPRQIVEVQAASPVMGRWDRLRIEQVVTNLLGNAMKFGEGKPIHVALTSASEVARLTIRDEGIGISPGDQARIFDRFEQAVSCKAHGGLGLGLFIVKQIVLAHGGHIEVQSAPGEGSVFTVALPQVHG
jgi:signal transduction histidine kinase